MSRGQGTTSSRILPSRQPRSSLMNNTSCLEITLLNYTHLMHTQILPTDLFDLYSEF